MKNELTISRIFQRHVTRLTVFVGILFLLICSVQAILLSLQSHRNACLLFGQRLAEAEGPLARELGLGESTLAREIFSDLESKLTATGASTNLNLVVGAQFIDNGEACNASAFSAQVSYPIKFGDVNVATIEGSIWSFPKALFFFGVLGVLAVLVLLLQLWARRLSQELSRQLIEPILAISKGSGAVNTLEAPQEVVEIAANLAALKFQLIEEGRKALEHIQILERNEMAQQVAHDIQSPLSVLSSLSKRRDSSEDHFRLLESVVDRIQNISASLLSKYKSEEIKPEQDLWINDLAGRLILEKRTLARSKGIAIRSVTSPKAEFCFATVAAGELSRALSNLIDNSIDALESSKSEDRELVISISTDEGSVSISVTDNGVGIPGDQIAGLGTRGTSYKPGGQGLGLYQARQFAERFGGTLAIRSTSEVGTTVTITLSKSRKPSWFVPGIVINPKLNYVIIDDDPAIHAIWKTRVPDAIHLTKVDDFEFQNFKLNPNLFFLFDYQLGHDAPTGLELIEKFGLEQRSIIVTSRYDNHEIQAKAGGLNVRIMPKVLIDFIPAQILCGGNFDLALIDDDELIHDNWRIATRSAGLRMASFHTVDEFLDAGIAVQTPVYLDQHLGNHCVGTEIGSKIAAAGYGEIHIVTGYDPETISRPKYISSIRQKGASTADFFSGIAIKNEQ